MLSNITDDGQITAFEISSKDYGKLTFKFKENSTIP